MKHGATMAAALAVHIASTILIMVPSMLFFLSSLNQVVGSGIAGAVIVLVHFPIGVSVIILTTFLVERWGFRRPPKMDCPKRRKLMRPTFYFWLLSLSMGVVIYVYYYVR